MVVPYPAGGGPDQIARQLCMVLGPLLKTSFVVSNKPGASGMLGLNEVGQSAPNGYVATYFRRHNCRCRPRAPGRTSTS